MFRVSWVLRGELAVGPAPRAQRHVDRLEGEGIKAVLSLASAEEAPLPLGIKEKFAWRRLVLPDHRSERLVKPHELAQALVFLGGLRGSRPVFVHCVAAMERSPLVCLALLMQERHLSMEQALDYLMQVHPGTNPLPSQLAVLRSFDSFRKHAFSQINTSEN